MAIAQEAASEVRIWYLGHSAWLAETAGYRLLFDYGRLPLRPAAGTLNQGVFDPSAYQDRPLYIFSSHQHADHFDIDLMRDAAGYPGTTLIVGQEGRATAKVKNLANCQIAEPRGFIQTASFSVWASRSTDSGVSFLAAGPDRVYYHGGDLAVWDDTSAYRTDFRREADWLAAKLAAAGRTLDIAFLPVSTSDGYQETALLDGVEYLAERLRPKHIFPMHAHGFEALYRDFADKMQSVMPEIRIHIPVKPGDSFTIS
ncbi:MAG: MBL fold metallo-hydrolase [Clostridiaceae bacterium]|nr:MBL fold metallo-hydrolase [Clostridiaceae bacterium]